MYRSSDSGPEIDRLENEFHKLIDEKGVLDQPIFKQFVELAEKELNQINALLLNDDSLLNEEGKRISKQRDLYRLMFKSFGVTIRDDAYKALEQLVDYKLGKE